MQVSSGSVAVLRFGAIVIAFSCNSLIIKVTIWHNTFHAEN